MNDRNSANINYPAILQLHKDHNARYDQVLSDAASYTVIYMFNMLLFAKSRRKGLGVFNSIPSFIFPLCLVCIFGIRLLHAYFNQLIESQGIFSQKIVIR